MEDPFLKSPDGISGILSRSQSSFNLGRLVDLVPFLTKTYSMNNLTNVTRVKFYTNDCSTACHFAAVM